MVVRILLVALALAAGAGYPLEHSGGPSVSAAKRAGSEAGKAAGSRTGAERGYRTGYAEGRSSGYRPGSGPLSVLPPCLMQAVAG